MKGEKFMTITPEKKPSNKIDVLKWGAEFEAEQNLEEITLQDIEEAFQKLELTSFDYLNQIVLQIKETLKPGVVSTKTGPEVRKLLGKAWAEIQLINNQPEVDKKKLQEMTNYFASVDAWLSNQKF